MFGGKNRGLLSTLESGLDIFLNLASISMAYIITVMFEQPGGVVPEAPRFMFYVFVVLMLHSFVFMLFNIYTPVFYARAQQRNARILRVNLFFYIVLASLSVLLFDVNERFVFFWVVTSAIVSTGVLLFKARMMVRISTFFKKRSFNLRKIIIIGDNSATVEDFTNQVAKNPQYGIMIVGYVGDKIHESVGAEKLGSFHDLARILDEYRPTDVVFAIDAYDKKKLIKLVNLCDDRCIKVYFLPVIYGFFKSARQLESVGSLPVINAHSTPLDVPFNAIVKRIVDIVGSLALIILTSPIMLVTAIGVYLSSPGPVLFKQERVGKMGRRFTMLKFRSMKVNARSNNSWSNEKDDRKTRFGAFIRKTSIDELPQLFNVLFGSMSLVGPRPEVPHFVEYFREIIPLYMVKHYVKPGMTGLAQVKGLRGDTSVEDRIHEDIEYIENWSLSLDIAILLKTPFKALNKAERYVEKAEDKPEEATDLAAERVVNDAPPTVSTEQMEDVVAERTENERGYKGKILYAASTMSHINNFHLQYIESLRRDGYRVKVMANGEGADYNVPFEKKMFSSENTACRSEIRKIIARENFDAIVLNTSLAAFHIRLALPRSARPRVVNIVHGYLFSRHTNPLRSIALLFAEKLVASRTDDIIVMNEHDRRTATVHRLCRGRVIVSRGMGAAVRDVITPIEKIREETLSEGKFAMAFVGELSGRKNQRFLISALNEVKEKIPNAVLWLVGDGPAEESLRSFAGEVDLSESVHFLGHRDDACDIIRACDLYVSASTIEGMPFNIIEALGCGKTILASEIKGHTDLIEEGVSGFTFKYGSVRDFVSKAEAIYKGELSVKEEDVLARYHDFDNANVFGDTYRLIKEAIENE